MKSPLLAKCALRIFRKSVLNAYNDVEGYLKSQSGRRMLAGWSKPDARFFENPTWLKQIYEAMAEGFRQKEASIDAIYQEHNLFMKPWNEPIEQIPASKVTLWQGSQDKTCPNGNEQKIAQLINGALVERFPNEGHCVMFAKPNKLAEALAYTV